MQIYQVYHLVLQSFALGILATAAMDLFNLTGKHLRLHRGGSYALIGRWISGFFKGHFRYQNILQTPPRHNEVIVGIVSHYGIGIGLALGYLLLSKALLLSPANLFWAVTYGLATNALPWFIMFPAFGFGVLATNGPENNQLIRTSFLNHLGYGIALGLGALGWKMFFLI